MTIRAEAGGDKKLRVLFIGGWGRGGSTLLGNLLGSIPNAASVGELNAFWYTRETRAFPCGCGLDHDACLF